MIVWRSLMGGLLLAASACPSWAYPAAGSEDSRAELNAALPQYRPIGQPLGEVADAEFTRLFFGIWLSPRVSVPSVLAPLLAGAN
jgi:hypothetical protein